MPWRLEIPRTPCSSLHSMLYPVQPREIYVQLEYCLVIFSPFLHQEGSFGKHLGKINADILPSKILVTVTKEKKRMQTNAKSHASRFCFYDYFSYLVR